MKKTAVLLDTPKPARTYHIHITTNTVMNAVCTYQQSNGTTRIQSYQRCWRILWTVGQDS